MFVRTKKSPKTDKTSVQIVRTYRQDGKVRQSVVRHVGMAVDEDELKRLKSLAHFIKAKLESEYQLSLFPSEDIAQLAIRAREQKEKEKKKDLLPVHLKELREEQRVITGIHDIYGTVFRELGFHTTLGSPKRKVAISKALYHMVIARIAQPASKRKSVDILEHDFGIKLRLDTIYRMMDLLDDDRINFIKQRAYQAAVDLFSAPLDVVFYDCTTLYFESFSEDDLRKNGYSKDMKFNQPQVLLALMVTREGLPIGYEVYSGNKFEGHTLQDAVTDLRERYKINQVTFVADSALLNKENLSLLEEIGQSYIVGARLRNLSNSLKEKILNKEAYSPVDEESEENFDRIISIKINEKRRLIVSYNVARAEKDRLEREKSIHRLQKKLEKSSNPRGLLSNYGYKKFLKVEGNSRLTVDEKKLVEDQKWDGLHGVITNCNTLPNREVLSHYHGLWKIEESFRVSKYDLRIRPIYHWTPQRVRAHIAICFMALVCVRNLEYRLENQYKKLSCEVIRNQLLHVQLSILKDSKNKRWYALPSSLPEHAKKIYKVVGKSISTVPYEIK